MTGTYTPETVGVPKELLFEDFKQQSTNLQGQYTRMHNRMQLMIGLNTALLPTLGLPLMRSSEVRHRQLPMLSLAHFLNALQQRSRV